MRCFDVSIVCLIINDIIMGLAHGVSVHIAHAQTPHLNFHADLSSGARDLKVGLSLHLFAYLVYARNEGSGESAHVRRLA